MKHGSNLPDFLQDARNVFMRGVAEVTRYHQKILSLDQRTISDVEEPCLVLAPLALGSFRNIRRHREDPTPQLGNQSVAFICRQSFGQLIGLQNKCMALLPHL